MISDGETFLCHQCENSDQIQKFRLFPGTKRSAINSTRYILRSFSVKAISNIFVYYQGFRRDAEFFVRNQLKN